MQLGTGHLGLFSNVPTRKNENAVFFKFSLSEFEGGIGYFNRPGPEIGYIFYKNSLKETFWTTLQNRKPWMNCTLRNNQWPSHDRPKLGIWGFWFYIAVSPIIAEKVLLYLYIIFSF